MGKKSQIQPYCLNCGEDILSDANFCTRCGQSIRTRRFSISAFLKRDLFQAIFSFEKGFFFSLWQLLRNPGKTVFEYMEGKRASHLSFGSFYMVLLGFLIFFTYFSELEMVDILKVGEEDKAGRETLSFYEHNPKISNLVQIPLMAVFSWIFFWKAKLNFSEHLVLNVYRLSIELIFLILISILSLFMTSLYFQEFGYFVAVGLSAIYALWLYVGFFGNYFNSKIKVVVLSGLCYLVSVFLGGVLLMIAIQYFPLKTFRF